MATDPSTLQSDSVPEPVPALEPGDRLTRAEFERRYQAMPHVKKAELIEGVVYMPSPVRFRKHGKPNSWIVCWLATYESATPGVESADNATARLDLDNEPQPDGLLLILPECGQCRMFVLRGGQFEPLTPSADGYLRSPRFPGLWVDAAAMIRGDLATALATVQRGAASPEHAAFVAQLNARKSQSKS